MHHITYTPEMLGLTYCNASAFKQGKAVGTCLKYQKAISGHRQSLKQSKNLWDKLK